MNNFSIDVTNNVVCVRASIGDTVVASLECWKVLDEIQINDVFVDVEQRRKGIATEMLNRLFAFARECKCNRVTLEVRESNNPAIKLYQKLGFKQVGERKNYYQDNGETAILMDAIVK